MFNYLKFFFAPTSRNALGVSLDMVANMKLNDIRTLSRVVNRVKLTEVVRVLNESKTGGINGKS